MSYYFLNYYLSIHLFIFHLPSINNGLVAGGEKEHKSPGSQSSAYSNI